MFNVLKRFHIKIDAGNIGSGTGINFQTRSIGTWAGLIKSFDRICNKEDSIKPFNGPQYTYLKFLL